MTSTQKALLDYIRQEIAATGICPSYDEMATAVSLRSKSSVHALLRRLEERGHIRRLPNRRRAIEVVDDAGITQMLCAALEDLISHAALLPKESVNGARAALAKARGMA